MRYMILSLALLACSQDANITSVRLDVRYEPAWGLTRLGVIAEDARAELDAQDEIRLLLPDDLAGSPHDVAAAAASRSEMLMPRSPAL